LLALIGIVLVLNQSVMALEDNFLDDLMDKVKKSHKHNDMKPQHHQGGGKHSSPHSKGPHGGKG